MQRFLSPIIAFCALVIPVVSANADATAEARKSIQAKYDTIDRGAVQRDAKTVLSCYAPHYIQIQTSGQRVDLAHLRKTLPKVMANSRSVKSSSKIQTLRFLQGTHDRQAIVIARIFLESAFPEKNSKKRVKLAVQMLNADTWIKSPRGWLMAQSRSISQKVTMNGKPVQ